MLANIARVLFKIVAAPGMQWFPHAVTESFLNLQSQWKIEYADTPAAVLSTTTGKARAQYSPRGYKPSWVLKVVIKDGKLLSHKQVPFSEDIKAYTAISYPMESAEQLAEDDKFKPGPPPPDGRRYSLADRQIISGYLLMLYCSRLGDGAEYVWLDEFCLSDHGLSKEYDNSRIYLQRNEELGRLADIFRYAAQVVVFCHLFGCDHTSLSCPWGNRVWTIPEILHAQKVLQMTRETGSPIPTIGEVSGDIFREKMQYHAAEGNQWHL